MSAHRRSRGALTREELRLWAEVARTAKPLHGKAVPDIAADPPEIVAPKAADSAMRGAGRSAPMSGGAKAASPSRATSPPPLDLLEKRLVRRLRRGAVAPGAVIDLHGLRQEEALARLQGFLRRCQSEGAKTAIVITGKGGRGGADGVLRRAVPHWLALPALRPLIVGFAEAGAGLGGSGALIVRVRSASSRRSARPGA